MLLTDHFGQDHLLEVQVLAWQALETVKLLPFVLHGTGRPL